MFRGIKSRIIEKIKSHQANCRAGVVAFFVFLLFSSMAYAATDIAVTATSGAPDVSGAPGSTVSVSIVADFSVAVNSIQFQLKFDPKLLQVSSVTLGSANSSWVMASNPNNTSGIVNVAMYNPGTSASAVSDLQQQIAVINFTVNNPPGDLATSFPWVLNNVDFDALNGVSQADTTNSFILNVPPVNYNLTINTTGYGAVTCGDSTTICSTTVNSNSPPIEFFADPVPGNALSNTSPWMVTGSASGSDCSGTTGTCTVAITAATIVTANFSGITNTIQASSGANGTVTPTGTTPVAYNGSQQYSITPSTNYQIASVTVDGSPLSAPLPSTYNFTSVTGSHTISATFSLIPSYSISATVPNGGGTITTSASSVLQGGSTTLTITPATGYSFVSLVLNGTTIPTSSLTTTSTGYTYNVTNIISTQTAVASFSQVTFNIQASSGSNGSVTPTGTTPVAYNGSQQYSITPSNNYQIASITVDGSLLSAPLPSTYNFTSVTAPHTISATFALIPSYSVTASVASGQTGEGTITSSASSVLQGGSTTLTITPATGYHLASLTLNNVTIPISSLTATTSGYTYLVSNITVAQNAVASFSQVTYNIQASSGANGTVTPTGTTPVAYNGSQQYSITPSNNYQIASVTVDNSPLSAPLPSIYNFTSVTGSHTISATFSLIPSYSISATVPNGGGTITTSASSVLQGGSTTLTITPATGYSFVSLVLNGTTIPTSSLTATSTGYTYNVTNITNTQTAVASFSQVTFNIQASSGANGTVTPTGTTTVAYNGSQSYAITPSTNYQIASVTVDNSPLSAPLPSTYNFTSVTAPHTISATFSLIPSYSISATVPNGGGTITTSASSVLQGGSTTLTITPATGYSFVSLVLNGTTIPTSSLTTTSTGYTYNVTNIISTQTAVASFSQVTFNIQASSGSNGSVTPTGTTPVAYNGSQQYSITPSNNYQIASITVDGSLLSAPLPSTYNFTSVTAPHTISATFALIPSYSVTASVASGQTGEGTITSSASSVLQGGSATLTITPATGYHFVSLTLNGTTVPTSSLTATTSGYTYLASNITVAQNAVASFSQVTFNIQASSGANGTVTPTGTTPVAYNGSQSYAITPSNNYQIASITVDGSLLSAPLPSTYNFTSVTGSHTISVTFSLIPSYSISATVPNGGGTITTSASSVLQGGSTTLTITPATGYHLASLTLNNVTIPISSLTATTSGYTYLVSNITVAQNAVASFSQVTFNIQASSGSNGSVTPTGTTPVAYNGSQQYSITPSNNYQIASITVDGSLLSAPLPSTYNFTSVTGSHTISATFALIPSYSVTASVASGQTGEGTITSSANSVLQGGSTTLTITPATGYSFVSLVLNGTTIPTSSLTATSTGYTYNVTNIISTQTAVASFSQVTFNIQASSGSNGSVTPTGTTPVAYNGSQQYSITPSNNYQIASITVDGSLLSAPLPSTYNFTSVTGSHTISATFSLIPSYSISATVPNGGGTITTSASSVLQGGSTTLTITPATGYSFVSLVLNGTTIPTSSLTATSTGYTYNVTNITNTQTAVANFSQVTYNIQASSGSNGSVTPTGTTPVAYNGSQQYSITPSNNYQIASITVDGSLLSAPLPSTYNFTSVTGSHTISATFSLIPSYSITASVASGQTGEGTITSSASSVLQGGSTTLTITPATGYHLASLTLNNVTIPISSLTATTSGYTYLASNITVAQNVVASFSQVTYNIQASSGANGTVTPTGTTPVAYNGSQSYAITPSNNYQIASVTVDGGLLSAPLPSTYNFTSVTGSHTISATFSLIPSYSISTSVASGQTGEGTITSSANSVLQGGSTTLTITPATGYSFVSLVLNGTTIPTSSLTATSTGYTYNVTNITNTQTAVASFSQVTFNIQASSGANGTVTPTGTTPVTYNGSQQYSITPSNNYQIASVTVDNSPLSAPLPSTYNFTSVTAPHTISATFALIPSYSVTASVASGQTGEGTITSSASSVLQGGSTTLTITPATGYHLASLTLNNVTIPISSLTATTSGYTYLASNITVAQNAVASFSQVTFNIQASSGANGTVTPTGTTTVAYNGSQSYAITPSTNYQIASVTVDGSPLSAPLPSTYNFTSVTGPHTISATFSLIPTITVADGTVPKISTATNNPATIPTNPTPVLPVITAQPSNLTVTAPATATFSAIATGTPTPNYQWESKANGAVTWTVINGATGPSYTTPATTMTNSGTIYELVATNTAGIATSNPATLTVNLTPVVEIMPAYELAPTITAGTTNSNPTTLIGNPTPLIPNIPNQLSNPTVTAPVTAAVTSGATDTPTPDYTTPVITPTVANNGTGNELGITNPAGIPVNNPTPPPVNPTPFIPIIITQPDNQSVTESERALFTSEAIGIPKPNYQWEISTNYGSTWTNINGATGSSYLTPATAIADSGTEFKVIASNSVGKATSNPATLSVNQTSLSPDGTILKVGTGKILLTSAGAWSFGAVGLDGNIILLNGHQAGGGSSIQLLVYNKGQMYSLSNSKNWYVWGSSKWSHIVGDPRTSPSTPTNLVANVISTSQINLSWKVSISSTGVSGFKIYRNGTQVGTSASMSYSDTGLSASTTYLYSVSAYDAAGNSSPITKAVIAETASLSPNGTVLNSNSIGTLETSSGTWKFSPVKSSGGNVILLNGKQAGNGSAVMLLVYKKQVYFENNQGNWYIWKGSSWSHIKGNPR